MPSDFDSAGEAQGNRVTGEQPLLAFADALLSANQREPGKTAGAIQQFVTFFLRDDEVGIPILQCREIIRAPVITRVPEAPEHVRGVVNLRGRILPAVDTRMCLGYEAAPPTVKSRLIVVEVAGRSFALLVDRVARILKLAVSEIAAPPESAKSFATLGVAQAGDAMIYLTDVERILRVETSAESLTLKE